jgi:hypothetical protein
VKSRAFVEPAYALLRKRLLIRSRRSNDNPAQRAAWAAYFTSTLVRLEKHPTGGG